uniref:Uncharacterized protein n=1 Tax=Cacopsylla melanoneura TaxID=428564 RepID=A0A8D8UTL2_9HEMI
MVDLVPKIELEDIQDKIVVTTTGTQTSVVVAIVARSRQNPTETSTIGTATTETATRGTATTETETRGTATIGTETRGTATTETEATETATTKTEATETATTEKATIETATTEKATTGTATTETATVWVLPLLQDGAETLAIGAALDLSRENKEAAVLKLRDLDPRVTIGPVDNRMDM